MRIMPQISAAWAWWRLEDEKSPGYKLGEYKQSDLWSEVYHIAEQRMNKNTEEEMSKQMLGPVEKTARGFGTVQFKDHYGNDCSLQASSLAIYEKPGTSAVWLGCDEANPKRCIQGSGWVPVQFPEDTLFNTRMHLNREQVESLVAHLQAWLEKGSFDL